MGAVSSFVGSVTDAIGGAVDSVVNTVGDIGKSIDKTVRDVVPGGWGTVAAVAGATMGLPTEVSAAVDDGTTAGILDAGAVPASGATSLPVAPPTDITPTALPPASSPLPNQQPVGFDYVSGAPTDPFAYTPPEMSVEPPPWTQNPGSDMNVLPGEGDPTVADTGLTTPSTSPSIGDAFSNFLGNKQLGNLTGAGLLAGGAGLAGLLSLMNSDSKRFGTPGRQNYTGPLSRYKFNPSTYQASAPNPAAFRPTGVTTVADQQFMPMRPPAQQRITNPFAALYGMGGMGSGMGNMFGFAKGGSTSDKPEHKSKAQLAVMDPWTRAAAEYQNAAYAAQSPTAPVAAPTGPRLGQLNLKSGGLGGYSDGGRMLKGPGDGMSDSIPATIGGKRPARLADGEFVVPADVVSHLGNGSTEAGARELYKMMDNVRRARTGRKTQGKQIKPGKFMPK
jgi:hypothetical protein